MAQKTSLQKSHSKASNAKLTLLCLLTAIVSTCIWAGLAVIAFMPNIYYIGIVIAIVSFVLSILCINLLGKFTR
ncbi:MAG: hypothetical protein IKP12_04735 [Acholeplasmatales bacterium]|nr:hypothetical protein [Acholeplasmatales bacterium]